MSVVVFDGNTLAADSQINNGQVFHPFPKIIEVPANIARGQPRTLAAAVGHINTVGIMLQWVVDGQRGGAPPEAFGGAQLVVVTKEKGLIRFAGNRTPLLHGFNKLAIGEGAPFAYGAMSAIEQLDATPINSMAWMGVEAAIEHSPHCNGEPITFTL